MGSLEMAKYDFGSEYDEEKGVYDVCHVDMVPYQHRNLRPSRPYGENPQFFKPIVKKILELVQTQIDRARRNRRQVPHTILVGGFGENEFFDAHMREFCETKEPQLKLSCPPNCQSARFQFHKNGIWQDAMVDEESQSTSTGCKGGPVPPGKTLTKLVQREVKQGEALDFDEVEIFKAPQFEYPLTVELAASIEIKFKNNELATARSKKSQKLGMEVTLLHYNIEVNMSSDLGIFTVAVIHDTTKRQMGTATIQFQTED
ncbi:hypothetical protein IWZ03DRAFT_361424 [Phyllosticta citriasiana]|uniref:Hsp70 family protein n=1 Tax=Phyllosticta citriasiana TaxID=595635 RepID=A0ABR1KJE3_9PEZI